MINTVIFSDEITVWWDKEWALPDGIFYRISLNNKKIRDTDKTHLSIKDLSPSTRYCVRVDRLEKGKPVQCLGAVDVTTSQEKRRIDVCRAPYFAIGDGLTVNTAALQKAIDDCGRDDCVYFPQGTFLSGSLRLHSDLELYLDEGATLKGTANIQDYLPKIKSRFEGWETECYSSLLNAGELDSNSEPNCRNIIIRGKGSILGGGVELSEKIIETEKVRLREYLDANAEYVSSCECDRTIPGRQRGRLINLSNTENVIISGLTLGFAASWNVHFIYSRNIITYGCRILSRGVWNGDGWDPDSSENCTIFDTEFKTHDNSIAIKSGKNPEGNLIGRPSRGIRVFDCHGGNSLAIGSEMSGGVSDVFVWDCDFSDTVHSGFGIKFTQKRGGYIKNVKVRNCRFVHLLARCVDYNDDGEAAKELTEVENISFENIDLSGIGNNLSGIPTISERVLLLRGLENPENYIKNITLKDIRILKRDGIEEAIEIKNTESLTVNNITFIED
jgi:polygalacturonase